MLKNLKKTEKILIASSLTLILTAILFYNFLPVLLKNTNQQGSEHFIGLTASMAGDIKIRYGDSISWKRLELNERIYGDSYLFSGPKSKAHFVFIDESSLKLEENSMIYLSKAKIEKRKENKNPELLNLDFVNGEIQIKINEETIINNIQVNNSVIDFKEGKTHLRLLNDKLEERLDVSVLNGRINLEDNSQRFDVINGEKLQISRNSGVKKEKIPDHLKKKLEEVNKEDEVLKFADFENRSNFGYYIRRLTQSIVSFFR